MDHAPVLNTADRVAGSPPPAPPGAGSAAPAGQPRPSVKTCFVKRPAAQPVPAGPVSPAPTVAEPDGNEPPPAGYVPTVTQPRPDVYEFAFPAAAGETAMTVTYVALPTPAVFINGISLVGLPPG